MHAIGNLEVGGAEALLYRIVSGSPEIEHEVLSFGNANDHFVHRLNALGVQLHHVRPSPLSALQQVSRILQDSKPDVVQGWMYRANLAVGLIAKRMGIPVAWGIHNSSLETLSLRARMWIYAGGPAARYAADRIVMCSVRSVELHDRLGYGGVPYDIVLNGYDTSVFRPDEARRRQMRESMGLSAGTFVIGCVGRWHGQKDQPTLVRALGILKRQGVGNWTCILAGRGVEETNRELRELVEEEGLGGQVISLGQRDDMVDLMRAFDIHAISSVHEAFPNVVAEAMASGTPCLVTDVGDAPFMVGDTGWVAPPRSPEELARGLAAAHAAWSEGGEAWAERQRAARARVEQAFGFERMLDGYRKIWRDLARSQTTAIDRQSALH